MTNTELIKDMLERQKAYDEEVFKKHNVEYVSKSKLESALFDELGELMHAQKSDWCWWKFTQDPKDEAKVFEEYIDVVHFALTYEIKFGSGCYQDEDIKWNYNKLKTDLGFGQAYDYKIRGNQFITVSVWHRSRCRYDYGRAYHSTEPDGWRFASCEYFRKNHYGSAAQRIGLSGDYYYRCNEYGGDYRIL